MARTLKPLNARLAERLTAVVVFPTPPFLFANTLFSSHSVSPCKYICKKIYDPGQQLKQ